MSTSPEPAGGPAWAHLQTAPRRLARRRVGPRSPQGEAQVPLSPLDPDAGRAAGLTGGPSRGRPQAIVVGKTWVRHPPDADTSRKLALHSRYLRQMSVLTGPPGVRRVSGVTMVSLPRLPAPAGTVVFYTVAPLIAIGAAVGRRRCAIVCQSPLAALGVFLLRRLVPARLQPRVQVELHGDWRIAPRLYGSRLRKLGGPLSDLLCRWSLRQADRVRTVSPALEDLARAAGYRGPVERFLAFSDYDVFLGRPPVPLPERPKVIFIGVLEPPKGVDILVDAWDKVREAVPGAQLTIVGRGRRPQALHRRVARLGLGGCVTFLGPVSRPELATMLDESWCLVLPSRSEGLPRVVLEAMARGRAVVASDVAGIRDLLGDGREGRLVPPDDADALSRALVGMLADRQATHDMGTSARRAVEQRGPQAEYEAGIARLARWIASE